MIEDSLRRYGAGRSILADKNMVIVAGNKTLEQAVSIGMDDVIVVQSDGTKLVVVQRTDLDLTTDRAAKELAIADNRASQVSLDWEAEVLISLKDEVDLSQFFYAEEIEELLGAKPQNGPQEESKSDKKAKYNCTGGCGTVMSGPSGKNLVCGDCKMPYTECS